MADRVDRVAGPAMGSLSIVGDSWVGKDLTAAADARSLWGLTGKPGDARVIARFSWHRSTAFTAGVAAPPLADDTGAWVPIPGATRPTYSCTAADAGRWLKVVVVPVLAGAAAVGDAGNRPILRAITGPVRVPFEPEPAPPAPPPLAAQQRPQQPWPQARPYSPPRSGAQPPLQPPLGQQQPRASADSPPRYAPSTTSSRAPLEQQLTHPDQRVVVEGHYTAVADDGRQLRLHLSPTRVVAGGTVQQLEQHSFLEDRGAGWLLQESYDLPSSRGGPWHMPMRQPEFPPPGQSPHRSPRSPPQRPPQHAPALHGDYRRPTSPPAPSQQDDPQRPEWRQPGGTARSPPQSPGGAQRRDDRTAAPPPPRPAAGCYRSVSSPDQSRPRSPAAWQQRGGLEAVAGSLDRTWSEAGQRPAPAHQLRSGELPAAPAAYRHGPVPPFGQSVGNTQAVYATGAGGPPERRDREEPAGYVPSSYGSSRYGTGSAELSAPRRLEAALDAQIGPGSPPRPVDRQAARQPGAFPASGAGFHSGPLREGAMHTPLAAAQEYMGARREPAEAGYGGNAWPAPAVAATRDHSQRLDGGASIPRRSDDYSAARAQTGGRVLSGAGAGVPDTLREALEQLLEQHQEAVQQVVLEHAAIQQNLLQGASEQGSSPRNQPASRTSDLAHSSQPRPAQRTSLPSATGGGQHARMHEVWPPPSAPASPQPVSSPSAPAPPPPAPAPPARQPPLPPASFGEPRGLDSGSSFLVAHDSGASSVSLSQPGTFGRNTDGLASSSSMHGSHAGHGRTSNTTHRSASYVSPASTAPSGPPQPSHQLYDTDRHGAPGLACGPAPLTADRTGQRPNEGSAFAGAVHHADAARTEPLAAPRTASAPSADGDLQAECLAELLRHEQLEAEAEAAGASVSRRGAEAAPGRSSAASLLARLAAEAELAQESEARRVAQAAAPKAPSAGGLANSEDASVVEGQGPGRGARAGEGHDGSAGVAQVPQVRPSTSASSAASLRAMNEALAQQLTESTRLQVQMQRALDIALEQLAALQAAKERAQAAPPPEPAPQPPPPPQQQQPAPMPQAFIPPSREAAALSRAPLSAPYTLVSASASSLPQPRKQSVPAGNQLVTDAATVVDQNDAGVDMSHPTLPRGVPEAHLPAHASRARETASFAGAELPTWRSAADPSASAAHGKAEGSEAGNAPEESLLGGAPPGPDGAAGAGRHAQSASIGGDAGGASVPLSTAADPPDSAARDVVAAKALLALHKQRWRAKKAKLKEQARAWQYTAWRYATAWKKARATLQAVLATQQGGPAAAAAAEEAGADGEAGAGGSPPPASAPPPGSFRPLAPEPRAAAAAGEGGEAPAQLSPPGLGASLAAALRRRSQPLPSRMDGDAQTGAPAYSTRATVGGSALAPSAPSQHADVHDRTRSQRTRGTPHWHSSADELDRRRSEPNALAQDQLHAGADEVGSTPAAARPDSYSNRDQLSRGRSRSAGRARHSGDGSAAGPVQVAARWPATLRSAAEKPRSRSPRRSPRRSRSPKPPWRPPAGPVSSPPLGGTSYKPHARESDTTPGDLPDWPEYPLEPPLEPLAPPPVLAASAHSRDPRGWWCYPDMRWLDIHPRPPHVLVQQSYSGAPLPPRQS